jgi:hypothetical protein
VNSKGVGEIIATASGHYQHWGSAGMQLWQVPVNGAVSAKDQRGIPARRELLNRRNLNIRMNLESTNCGCFHCGAEQCSNFHGRGKNSLTS